MAVTTVAGVIILAAPFFVVPVLGEAAIVALSLLAPRGIGKCDHSNDSEKHEGRHPLLSSLKLRPRDSQRPLGNIGDRREFSEALIAACKLPFDWSDELHPS